MAVLKGKSRKRMADSSFAIVKTRKAKRGAGVVKERKYPIHDLAHARNALARVASSGTSAEKKTVKATVYRKYPGLKKRAAARRAGKR